MESLSSKHIITVGVVRWVAQYPGQGAVDLSFLLFLSFVCLFSVITVIGIGIFMPYLYCRCFLGFSFWLFFLLVFFPSFAVTGIYSIIDLLKGSCHACTVMSGCLSLMMLAECEWNIVRGHGRKHHHWHYVQCP